MKRVFVFVGVVLSAVFIICGQASAIVYSLNFSGQNVTVMGEYVNAVPVPVANQEFAPHFYNAQTISGSIIYDTSQPDVDPSPNTGTYRIGTLNINMPEIGLSASRFSNSMQISAFNDTPNPDDQFFAYTIGVDSFSNTVGLPSPFAYDVLLFGSVTMLSNDQLPTSPINWTFGNVSFDFYASDNTLRQVLMTFTPPSVPEHANLLILLLSFLSIVSFRYLR